MDYVKLSRAQMVTWRPRGSDIAHIVEKDGKLDRAYPKCLSRSIRYNLGKINFETKYKRQALKWTV